MAWIHNLFPNLYESEYNEIISEYSTGKPNEYKYDLINNVLNSKLLSNEFYEIGQKYKTVNTTNGIKRLPYPIAIIIMYYREDDLIDLMTETLMNVSTDFDSPEFKKYYEQHAIEIREKYNKLINYYNKETMIYLSNRNK